MVYLYGEKRRLTTITMIKNPREEGTGKNTNEKESNVIGEEEEEEKEVCSARQVPVVLQIESYWTLFFFLHLLCFFLLPTSIVHV